MRGIKQTVTDHTGRQFDSLLAMCKYYKINCDTYLIRIKRGWTKEKALTTPIECRSIRSIPIDHLGNRYNSIKDMCATYGLPVSAFVSRRKMGWSLDKSLLTPVRPRRK